MNDIASRLRRWTHDANAAPASDLMDQAANEIERLRLAADERHAIERLIHAAEQYSPQWAAPLRRLLERTK